MHQQDGTGQARRSCDGLQEIQQQVLLALTGGLALVAVDEVVLVVELHEVVVPAGGHRCLGPARAPGVALVGRQVVPDHLGAVLRNRERNARGGTGKPVAAVNQGHLGRILAGGVINALRERCGAPARIHLHFPGGVLLEQRHLAGREVIGVLIGILPGDDELDRIVREGVGIVLRGFKVRMDFRDAAIPGRNAQCAVAGFFGAHRCQVLAEACRFGFGDSGSCQHGQGRRHGCRGRQCGRQQSIGSCLHGALHEIRLARLQ